MRVIAGSLKGRVLKAPKGNRTRPTADRVKEALFSMLGAIDGCNVLDLYAGTGALGIEALSRGARFATFIEASQPTTKYLEENLAALGLLGRVRVISAPVERAGREILRRAPYDVIFCDPPWSMIESVWDFLSKSNIGQQLAPGAVLVLEHPEAASTQGKRWSELSLVRNRAWGDSAVSILRKAI